MNLLTICLAITFSYKFDYIFYEFCYTLLKHTACVDNKAVKCKSKLDGKYQAVAIQL